MLDSKYTCIVNDMLDSMLINEEAVFLIHVYSSLPVVFLHLNIKGTKLSVDYF